jgi:hypothetical protein
MQPLKFSRSSRVPVGAISVNKKGKEKNQFFHSKFALFKKKLTRQPTNVQR